FPMINGSIPETVQPETRLLKYGQGREAENNSWFGDFRFSIAEYIHKLNTLFFLQPVQGMQSGEENISCVNGTISSVVATCKRKWSTQDRPHRYRNPQLLWLPNEVRPKQGISHGHYQKTSFKKYYS